MLVNVVGHIVDGGEDQAYNNADYDLIAGVFGEFHIVFIFPHLPQNT